MPKRPKMTFAQNIGLMQREAIDRAAIARPLGLHLWHAALLDPGIRPPGQRLAGCPLVGMNQVAPFRVAIGVLAQEQAHAIAESLFANDEGKLPQNAGRLRNKRSRHRPIWRLSGSQLLMNGRGALRGINGISGGFKRLIEAFPDLVGRDTWSPAFHTPCTGRSLLSARDRRTSAW